MFRGGTKTVMFLCDFALEKMSLHSHFYRSILILTHTSYCVFSLIKIKKFPQISQ